jgi:hypothetical protein
VYWNDPELLPVAVPSTVQSVSGEARLADIWLSSFSLTVKHTDDNENLRETETLTKSMK